MAEEEVYYEIRHASNEELLEAAIMAYVESYKDDPYLKALIERSIRIGFRLAQEDGWRQVAPAWLTDWRNRKEK